MLTLIACADPTVVWEDPAADDAVSDAVEELFTLGLAYDDDGALVDATHAAGTRLRMDVHRADDASVAGWELLSLSDEVCELTVRSGSGALGVEMDFRQAGSTALYVYDDEGLVVDWRPIEVRDPADVQIYRNDMLAVGWTESVVQLDVLPGSTGALALTWLDAEGGVLSGVGLLDAVSDNEAVEAHNRLVDDGAYEAFDVIVAGDAASGASLSLRAGETEVATLPVVLHAPEEVDGIYIDGDVGEISEDDLDTRGWLRAVVSAGSVDLFGAKAGWKVDGTFVGEGSWVRVEGEDLTDLHEISACYGEICDSRQIAGTIVGFGDPSVNPWGCSCNSGAPELGLAGVVWALSRRRRARR